MTLLDTENNFAEMLILFHHPMRLNYLINREHLLNDRYDGTVSELGQRSLGKLGNNGGLVFDRTGAQYTTDDLLTLDHHQSQIQFCLDTTDNADNDRA